MSIRTDLRHVPGLLAAGVLAVGALALLVKAVGLLALALVVLLDRALFAVIAGADWADERMSARAGVSPLSRLGFSTTGGGAPR